MATNLFDRPRFARTGAGSQRREDKEGGGHQGVAGVYRAAAAAPLAGPWSVSSNGMTVSITRRSGRASEPVCRYQRLVAGAAPKCADPDRRSARTDPRHRCRWDAGYDRPKRLAAAFDDGAEN